MVAEVETNFPGPHRPQHDEEELLATSIGQNLRQQQQQ
jgi:hypothetical protein